MTTLDVIDDNVIDDWWHNKILKIIKKMLYNRTSNSEYPWDGTTGIRYQNLLSSRVNVLSIPKHVYTP